MIAKAELIKPIPLFIIPPIKNNLVRMIKVIPPIWRRQVRVIQLVVSAVQIHQRGWVIRSAR